METGEGVAVLTEDNGEDAEVLPERRLLAAIINMALSDALGINTTTSSNGRQRQRDARYWLLYDEIEQDAVASPFSFAWICQHLGMEPETLRHYFAIFLRKGQKKREDLWMFRD